MATSVRAIIRRGHLKSKTGCFNCKRRRVKCDEFHPICRQCHKLGLQCMYPARAGRPNAQQNAALLWPSVIEQACVQWQESGRFPFPAFSFPVSPGWHTMPLSRLRYIYQMALIESMLSLSGTKDIAIVWGEVDIIIQLAVNFDYLANTIAALSAERLAVRTGSWDAARDAARYCKQAVEGLSQAIRCFSAENADAILASYLCCQFILPEYRSFKMLTQTMGKVINKMQPWPERSHFSRVYAYELISDAQQSTVAQGKTTAMAMVNSITTPPTIVGALLQGIDLLDWVIPCFQSDPELVIGLRKERDTMRYIYERIGVEPIPFDTQYRLLYPFLSWFNKNKNSSYITLSERDPLFLFFLLEFISVILVLVVALPATDTPFLASFRARAVLDLLERIEVAEEVTCPGCGKAHLYRDVVGFPLNAVRLYQQRRRTTGTQAVQLEFVVEELHI